MRTGLRTEIILSISLLLAAALLFAGFLLLKLTEQGLLQQQQAHATGMIKLVVSGLGEHYANEPLPLEAAATRLSRLQTVLGQQAGVAGWRLLDERLQLVSSMEYAMSGEFTALSPSALSSDDIYQEMSYRSSWFSGHQQGANYLDLSMPIRSHYKAQGLLQVRFSLEELRLRVQKAQRLMMVYVVLYGLTLAGFALYLLNRNVVRPVRQLHSATTTVADGSLTPVVVSSGPGEIHDLASSFNRMVAALADSRRETEEHIASLEESNLALAQARDDLIRSEKLATVGHLAAGMAHEIGNPLAAIIGYLNILQMELVDDTSHDLVKRSLAEAGRIDKLVRELLEYSSAGSSNQEVFNPVLLLREAVELLQHQGLYDDIKVFDLCSPDGCVVSMDRSRLLQVWINLLLNARDAICGAGRVELSSTKDADKVTVAVKDNGEGMDAEVVARVFEPFYTTKDPGKGYGLGLAVCQRIIAEQNGRMDVVSTPKMGTTFTVTLPCFKEQS